MATANLTWDAVPGATSYKVEYKLSADLTWTLYSNTVPTNAATIPGLINGTDYDFRVTTHCVAGDSGTTVISDTVPCAATIYTDGYYVVPAIKNIGSYDEVIANRRDTSYGNSGTKIFQVGGYSITGGLNPGYSTTNLTTSSFWNNVGATLLDGRMNNLAFWSADACISPTFETIPSDYIGVSAFIHLDSARDVYFGLGVDGIAKLIIDGITIIQHPTFSVNNMRWWNIYPVSLAAGAHLIEIVTKDSGTITPCMALEVYDNTEAELVAATSLGDLNILYSTDYEFCRSLTIGQTIGGTAGYHCPAHFSIDGTTNPPTCVKLM